MKYFTWDPGKNEKLRAERGISFEEIVYHIEKGDVLDILEHPNQEKYEGQRVFIVRAGDYAYLVPFIETENEVTLKTIIPSRKATRRTSEGRQKMAKLDRKEKELLESVERGEWTSIRRLESERGRYQTYAESTFKKNRRVNIRISEKDLEAIQKRALEEGIPYQTLIASLLHKYASGRLIDKESLTGR